MKAGLQTVISSKREGSLQWEKEKALINENLSKKALKPPLAGDKPGLTSCIAL